LPCFEKPGTGFVYPELLIMNANWLSSVGTKEAGQAAGHMAIIRPGMPALRQLLEKQV
jgi:hypothetical protein